MERNGVEDVLDQLQEELQALKGCADLVLSIINDILGESRRQFLTKLIYRAFEF